MDPSADFTGSVEAWDVGFASDVDLDAPVLVMKGRVDEHGLFPDVDAELVERPVHGGELPLDCALAVLYVY